MTPIELKAVHTPHHPLARRPTCLHCQCKQQKAECSMIWHLVAVSGHSRPGGTVWHALAQAVQGATLFTFNAPLRIHDADTTSYKRVKGRSHSVEEQFSTQSLNRADTRSACDGILVRSAILLWQRMCARERGPNRVSARSILTLNKDRVQINVRNLPGQHSAVDIHSKRAKGAPCPRCCM